MTDARTNSLLSLIAWHERGTFIWDSLENWKNREKPDRSDLNFAYELSCGTMRSMRYLDALALRMVQKMPRKPKERMLLRLALYQRKFLPNIPLYAVVDTSVELAKQFAGANFASFLNAVLRKDLPEPKLSLAEKTSYTDYFVSALLEQYGEEQTRTILDAENTPCSINKVPYGNDSYIQNKTQQELIHKQAQRLSFTPQAIVDLCAAPGGKTLLLHSLFPKARLLANDIAESKIATLQENLTRFNCPAEVSNQPGESFSSAILFDLVLVDAPCSNSGVLYKCPEARWRIEKEEIEKLKATQLALLARAKTILKPDGRIWYQTCSILAAENEQLIQEASQQLGLEIDGEPFLQLPDDAGHEGGFACSFKNIHF